MTNVAKQFLTSRYMDGKIDDEKFHSQIIELDIKQEIEDRRNGKYSPEQMAQMAYHRGDEKEMAMWIKNSREHPHCHLNTTLRLSEITEV